MKGSFDVAVVGSGFAGSLLAMVCRRLGRSVVLVERGTHPRFAIGESSSPLANLLLEELCDRYGLSRIRPLSAWGTWQRQYPQIACGLKRGFTFYGHGHGHGHGLGRPFSAKPDRSDQLLVAASPSDEVADTHWFRADFDAFLVSEAREAGVEYLDRTRLRTIRAMPEGFELGGDREGIGISIRTRFVVDATGPGGFLHHSLPLESEIFAAMPPTQGLYTHFSGVRRLEEMGISPDGAEPPYAVDDAAVHHVFDGGWIWVLRFNNGITSAGVAATPVLGNRLALEEGAAAWERLLALLPTVQAQFARATPTLPFVFRRGLPFRTRRAAGDGWALVPSAAAFVDPLLSTGFPLTLLGLLRLARALETCWGRTSFQAQIAEYESQTLAEADRTALLVSALFACFGDFPLFAALSKLYFAAASFSEAARRLSREHLAGSFLCANHPSFGPAMEACCRFALALRARADRSPAERKKVLGEIDRAIEPIDVAGLADRSRRNWHPVLAEDLLAGASKLSASKAEISALLERSGFHGSRLENKALVVPYVP